MYPVLRDVRYVTRVTVEMVIASEDGMPIFRYALLQQRLSRLTLFPAIARATACSASGPLHA